MKHLTTKSGILGIFLLISITCLAQENNSWKDMQNLIDKLSLLEDTKDIDQVSDLFADDGFNTVNKPYH